MRNSSVSCLLPPGTPGVTAHNFPSPASPLLRLPPSRWMCLWSHCASRARDPDLSFQSRLPGARGKTERRVACVTASREKKARLPPCLRGSGDISLPFCWPPGSVDITILSLCGKVTAEWSHESFITTVVLLKSPPCEMSEQASHHGGERGWPHICGPGRRDNRPALSRKCSVLILMEISPREELQEYGEDTWDLLESSKGKETIRTDNSRAFTRERGSVNYVLASIHTQSSNMEKRSL